MYIEYLHFYDSLFHSFVQYLYKNSDKEVEDEWFRKKFPV